MKLTTTSQNALNQLQGRHALLACVLAASMPLLAAVPTPERLLPDDTLLMVTAPDFARMREIFKTSPQSQFWNDPAMRPFKDKFMTKLQEELIKPLERELDLHLDDFTSLPQGQVTLALTHSTAKGTEDDPPGLLLFMDTRDRSTQLKTNLANLRKRWVDANKTIRTEKVRDVEFSVLSFSSNDVPKSLKKFLPESARGQETAGEGKKAASKDDLVIGQVDSVLVLGSTIKAVEKAVTRLTGGSIPSLADNPAYDANHQALFRDAAAYGWVNSKALIDILARKADESKSGDGASPFGDVSIEKVLSITGISGLKSIAFIYRDSGEGSFFQLFAGVPEAGRQGVFKILAGEAKETTPPDFVPADAAKFERWRIDAQKTWNTLEKMLTDINPQWGSALNFLVDTANAKAKEKDPDFDFKKDVLANLGDDIVTYEKTARAGSKAAAAPSIFLLGSLKAERLATQIKSMLAAFGTSDPPSEREFLGRKVFSTAKPSLPFMPDTSKSGASSKLHWAAGGSYVAFSTDSAILEEYLRSSENKAKTLRETAGLSDAMQKVAGPGTSLFAYENTAQTMRAAFDLFKSSPSTSSTGADPMDAAMALFTQGPFKDWVDFSLLPAYDKVAKYFHFAVYAAGANANGLSLKFFAPVPPGLKAGK